MNETGKSSSATVPTALASDSFTVSRRGIFDDPNVSVMINANRTFAYLDPAPEFDYHAYVPRSISLDLGAYKKKLAPIARRFAKIADDIPFSGSLLEIGAAEGGFLATLRSARPDLELLSVEPDVTTKTSRDELRLAGDFIGVPEAIAARVQADVVCLFHVFEHIPNPGDFLNDLRRLLRPGGKLIIEVPALTDPLLTLYSSEAYARFYFQRQHPFVYSAKSLQRVLENAGLTARTCPFQRYGLSNHLAWLKNAKPGGDQKIENVIGSLDDPYRERIEASGFTDTVFAIAST